MDHMEAGMVTAAMTSMGRNTLVVRAVSAELIGVSGRPVGVLQRESEVKVHGELGPYTIVNYEGRNGYVLTECLGDRESLFASAQSQSQDGEVAEAGHRMQRAILMAVVPVLVAAASAGVFLAVA
jgi:hypothetical protein